ncbi:Tenascin-X [Folsomia candida]|uniref:Tenascin-X n=1 Tax=Folsomia candida TaxID=158441 RepID=A0A226DQC1_FOLCA|nr:Tenascin-X [Folsomia candida]
MTIIYGSHKTKAPYITQFFKCDNLEKSCGSTVCSEFERAECVLNKWMYGTRCKCIPIITGPYCNTRNITCSLRGVNEADLRLFSQICLNRGQDYFAETCRINGECRCDNTSPSCTVRGCESSLLRCGPDQTVPSCNATSRQCYCLNYQIRWSFSSVFDVDSIEILYDSMLVHRYDIADSLGFCPLGSCKCMPQGNCGSSSGKDCSPAFVSDADVERYDNICGQLGGAYFAEECGTEQCICKKRHRGCRQNADCPCPAGREGLCNVGGGFCVPLCGCATNEECTQRCPAGEKSICNRNFDRCTICAKNCSSDSDCTQLACPTDTPIRKCNTYTGCYCDIKRVLLDD